ncbi:MAG TPA: hypothetical protein VFW13_12900 [Phenylobacterium sp.]|nr:hypothetical protein [Phenylobacterium sp.]
MTTDFSATPDDRRTETESDMFAPVPAWERGKKRRGFGAGRTGRVAEEPRSFVSDEDDRATIAARDAREQLVREPVWPETDAIAPDGVVYERLDEPLENAPAGDSVFAGTPVYASLPSSGSKAPVAIAAGIILLGGAAAAGWYFMQPHATGMAQLTPGQAVTTTTTTAPAASDLMAQASTTSAPPPIAPTSSASPAPPPPAMAAASTTTTTTTHSASPAATHHAVASARPVSRSADQTAADASATLPASPQPYSGNASTPPAAASPAAAPVTSTPQAAAPAPAEPAAVPTPAPTATAPTPQTPPQ